MDHRETLRHLGSNLFVTMTGAKNFVPGLNSLSFRIGGGAKQRINTIKVSLENDTYTVEFFYFHSRGGVSQLKLIERVDGVFDTQLQAVFTRVTGMETHL